MEQSRLTISKATDDASTVSGDRSIYQPPKYLSRLMEPERTFISPYADPKSYLDANAKLLKPYRITESQAPQQHEHSDHNNTRQQTFAGDDIVPPYYWPIVPRLRPSRSNSLLTSCDHSDNHHIAEPRIKSEHTESLSTNSFVNGVMDPLNSPYGLQSPLIAPPELHRVKRTRSMSSTATSKKIKGETIYDDAERLLEDEKSPLYKDKTNLKEVLQHPKARSAFAISSGGYQLEDVDSDTFASAAAAFKDDGRGGRHDQEWLRQAQAASEIRRNGGFKDYHEAQFKKNWAEKSPELSGNEDDKWKDKDTGCHRAGNEKAKRRRDGFDDGDDDDAPTSGSGGNASNCGQSYSTSSKLSNNVNGNGQGNGNGTRPTYNKMNQLNQQVSFGGGDANELYGMNLASEVYSNAFTYDHLNPPFPISDSNSMYPKYPSSKYHKYYAWDVRQVCDSDWSDRGYCDNPNSVYPEPSHGDHDGYKRLPDPVLPTINIDYSSMIDPALLVVDAEQSSEPSKKRLRGRPRGSGTRQSPSKA